MKKIFLSLSLLFFVACNDGDFTIEQLNFDDAPVETPCGSLLLFKIGDGDNEALMIELQGESTDIFTSLPSEGNTRTYTIDNSSVKVLYRIFDGDVSTSYFCNDVPATTPKLSEEWYATGGTIQIVTSLVEDDDDGLPASMEGAVYNEDGSIDWENSQDTDGDGIPDCLDIDDDGDNVLTEDEYTIVDNELVLTDTDNDGIPNYLDTDDDGDGVDSRLEDLNGNNNPADDIQTGNTEPNYLISSLTDITSQTIGRRTHRYIVTYTNEISIIDGFQLISDDKKVKYDVPSYEFGTYEISTTVTE
ncbi:hypothetical protein [Robertkochia solimangrovi]|uniref:hypothetical protein n=1 Tax=Robertkochia solimangrovi TaxID=2213046 RepID=UPI00117EB208|nr:hypothetical protein [Robertkochia solimangrovi]TRZ43764.1 hypothetical protein DMZ48_10185 [Robertkochia solimangrovi]